MLIVETIGRIRRERLRDGKPIREIARDLKLARNTVRKALRSEGTEFRYERRKQPQPKLGEHVSTLESLLEEDARGPARERRTAMMLFEQLQRQGYAGGYDAVRRFVKQWKCQPPASGLANAFVPLAFDPGEAFQFDWSHEDVEIAGMPVRVKVAHLRLCYSRMPLCVAFPRESLEMIFEGHERAFRLFGGTCRKGIYDNMKTVVQKVLLGKDRKFNRRFQQFASHHLFEPVACTPGAGWEKGQVENQVGTMRGRLFVPRLKFASYQELNTHLEAECVRYAKTHKHPELDETVWEAFEREREHLVAVGAAFDGYKEQEARVSTTALVCFDHNRYSVRASEVGKTVAVRAYAERVVLVSEGEVVGDHPRQFGRNRAVYDPWHYLPVLERKPGALRNGAPFKNWDLPEPIQQVRKALGERADGDRQFVAILSAIPRYGSEAVCRACQEALAAKAVSRDVILNLVSRQTEEPAAAEQAPSPPPLGIEPVADCRRYDELLESRRHAA